MSVREGLPTIPQYYREHVDDKVDLNATTSIPCPFHDEKQGKSFSYSPMLSIWRCFGACHCGGNVIDLHRLNFRLSTYEEAEESLCRIYNVSYKKDLDFTKKEIKINYTDVHRRRAYAAAVSLAKTEDDWLELDYIVGKVPYDVKELEVYCSVRGLRIDMQEEA